MTQEFKDLGALARHFERAVQAYPKYLEKVANAIGAELVKSAKDKIGYLQKGFGQFQSWQPLAESTIADKERQGYLFKADGNPLYRTGELKDSILHVFNMATHILYFGSISEIMTCQEFGTMHTPPRSVIGLTLLKALVFIKISLNYFMIDWVTLKPFSSIRKITHD